MTRLRVGFSAGLDLNSADGAAVADGAIGPITGPPSLVEDSAPAPSTQAQIDALTSILIGDLAPAAKPSAASFGADPVGLGIATPFTPGAGPPAEPTFIKLASVASPTPPAHLAVGAATPVAAPDAFPADAPASTPQVQSLPPTPMAEMQTLAAAHVQPPAPSAPVFAAFTALAMTPPAPADPAAEAPVLTVAAATGLENMPAALDVTAHQADATLAQANLSLTVSGLQGAGLNHGQHNADGSYSLAAGDLAGLALAPTAGFTGLLTLTVVATDTEASSQASSTAQALATVAPNGAHGAAEIYGPFSNADLAPFYGIGDGLDIHGALDNRGAKLCVGPSGAFASAVLETGAVITGGVIGDLGAGMVFNGGALDGVTYLGTLAFTQNASLIVADTLTAATQDGTGPGQIDLTGFDTLTFQGDQTLDNAVITLSGAGGNTIADLQTLTLGAHLTIDQTSGTWGDYLDAPSGLDNASALINDGTILARASGGQLTISPTRFTNNGTMIVSNGDTLDLATTATNAASGAITAEAGSTLVLSTLINAGTVTADSATVIIDGYAFVANTGVFAIANSAVTVSVGSGVDLTTALLAPLLGHGDAITLYGALDNAGATLALGSGSGGTTLALQNGAAIVGGVIHGGGSGLAFNGGTLDGVTYQGPLVLANATLDLKDGLTVESLGGSLPGSITLGDNSFVTVLDSETLDNAVVGFSGAYSQIAAAQTLTLGAHLTVDATGTGDTLAALHGGALVNDGTILAEASQGSLFINAPSFTNAGTITVSNADTLSFQGDQPGFYPRGQTVTNDGLIDIQAGTVNLHSNLLGSGQIAIGDGSTLELSGSAASSQTIRFTSGAGLLQLDQSAAFGAHVSGFTGNDQIDFTDIGFVSASEAIFAGDATGGILTVSDGTHTAKVALVGDYLASTFVASSDGLGGVMVVDPVMQTQSHMGLW